MGGARCGRLSHGHPPRCARSESRPLPNLSHDDAARSHAPGAHRGQLPMRPAPCQVARPDATSRRDVWGRGEVGIWLIGHTCQPMRCRAQALNPLAGGFLISPEPNFPLRQCCARMRPSGSGRVPWLLTATAQICRLAQRQSTGPLGSMYRRQPPATTYASPLSSRTYFRAFRRITTGAHSNAK